MSADTCGNYNPILVTHRVFALSLHDYIVSARYHLHSSLEHPAPTCGVTTTLCESPPKTQNPVLSTLYLLGNTIFKGGTLALDTLVAQDACLALLPSQRIRSDPRQYGVY